MMNDPYNQILGLMREEGAFHNEPPFLVGEVISPLPNLKIRVNNIELDKDNLKIDKWLLDRAIETFIDFDNGSHSHGNATGDGSHKHEMREPLKNTLDIGDNVVMLKNGDNFIVISKVVSL